MMEIHRTGKRTRRTAAGLLPVLGALLGLAVGCYDPKISPNPGLMCAPAPAKRCPDGFVCNTSTNHCVVAGGSGGSSGSGGVGSGGIIGSGGSGGAGTGGVAGRPREVTETCTPASVGTPNQSDDCAPGLVCMNDCTNRARCYQICTDNTGCPSSLCSRSATLKTGTVMVCDVPDMACNPQDGSGCPAPSCFLLASQNTVCDCNTAGNGVGVHYACSESRECFPGYLCPPIGAGPTASVGFCQRVCDPSKPVTGCTGTEICRPFGAWGYCY